MTSTLEARLAIEADLEQLYAAAPLRGVGDRDQIREYIEVGEYRLALNDLADVYLEAKTPVTLTLRMLFADPAAKLGMRSGDQWRAVAEILATR